MSRRRLCLCLVMVFVALSVGCQPQFSDDVVRPRNTDCSQWDEGMRAVFNIALVIVIATPIVLAPLLGLLGRRYWFFTGPRRRLIVVSFVLLVLMIIAVPLGPWTTGLQWGWFSSVDARYFLCIDQNFGAQGLLMGYVSPGQSAISQWPAMIGILAAGALIGLLLGLGLQALAARWAGIRRKAASGGES